MIKFKLFALILISSLPFNETFSQNHCSAWLRGSILRSFNNHLSFEGEFQYRRQNGLSNCYILENSLSTSLRTWLHLQKNIKYKISISPVALFYHHKLINNYSDKFIKPESEIRSTVAIERKFKLGEKKIFDCRLGAEYRFFTTDESSFVRLRNRTSYEQLITKKFKITVFDEIFFNVYGTRGYNLFDQNRVGVLLKTEIISSWKIDFGLMKIIRRGLTEKNITNESNIVLNLTHEMH